MSRFSIGLSIDAVTYVNVKSLAEEAARRAEALARAEALVVTDEEILGGASAHAKIRRSSIAYGSCLESCCARLQGVVAL